MRVAVLGCGPAGLMAAHAAALAGANDVRIISKKRKSEMFGSQYLHAPIPGMTDTAPVTVHYELVGSVEEYRRKVYGEKWDGTVSPEDLLGEHDAWDIRQTYDSLWSTYGDFVYSTELSAGSLENIIVNDGFDLVISTVPKNLLCRKTGIHTFAFTEVWAVGDAPERGVFVPGRESIPNNTVRCNGEDAPRWYRLSKLFNYATCEWPMGAKPPIDGISRVTKPTFNNCDCWPDILFVGRYGKWEKGVLSHEAFIDTMDKLVVEPVR